MRVLSVGSTTRSKKPWPTKGAPARRLKLVPPSVDRRMPAPHREYQFPSPVPTYTMAGLAGSNAIAPVVSVGASSVRGDQDAPESKDCQTPPPAPLTSRCAGLVGSTAIALTRPITSTRADPYVWPLCMQLGPSQRHD